MVARAYQRNLLWPRRSKGKSVELLDYQVLPWGGVVWIIRVKGMSYLLYGGKEGVKGAIKIEESKQDFKEIIRQEIDKGQ